MKFARSTIRFHAKFHPQILVNTSVRREASSYGGPPTPGQVGPQAQQDEDEEPKEKDQSKKWNPTFVKIFESATTTFASLLILG